MQNYLRDQRLPRYARNVGRSASARRAFNFSVRRTYRELNEAPKRSSDSEESAIRDFTVCSLGIRCVYRWPITLLLKLPVTTGQTRTMWSDNIMISYIHVNFVKHFTNSRNRTRTFLLERYMIQSIFPSNISPGGTLHFCHGGTCHKVSFRQQELTNRLYSDFSC